jgi:hypothetical protein
MDKVKIVAGVLHDECKKRWKNYSFSNDPHHENEHIDMAKKVVEALESMSNT